MLPVYISSYMAVTACGHGNQALFQALSQQQTGLKPARLIQPDSTMYTGEVEGELPQLQDDLQVYQTRNTRLALAALNCEDASFRQAVEDAKHAYGTSRIGIIIGTSTSGIYETEQSYQCFAKTGEPSPNFDLHRQHAWIATAEFLKKELQLLGPCYAISTACSSSGKAIAAGQRLIASGLCDAVVVGGVDSMCHLTVHGFYSLALTSETPCTPLDIHRHGISLAEGAGLLLLEAKPKDEHTPCLLGYGESSDAHHMTAPHPEGEGSKRAMQIALQRAHLSPHDMDYINLHATGTIMNDASEMKAMSSLFGSDIACSATKGLTGHTLGAAGAIEAIITLLALKHQMLPGTYGLQTIDPDFNQYVIREPLHQQTLSYAMSNNFGFGGNNISLTFSRQNVQETCHA